LGNFLEARYEHVTHVNPPGFCYKSTNVFGLIECFHVSSTKIAADALDAVSSAKVRREFERILASSGFRDSKRSREFLSFIVEAKLAGREEGLKERTIGVEVFQRDPSYNTSDDSIVRVKATEVRKRLSRYNSLATDQEVRIEMQLGSYIPEFTTLDPMPDATEPARPSPNYLNSYLRYAASGLAALILLATAGWFALTRASSPLDQFWAPMLKQNERVMICLGYPTVYILSKRVHDRFEERAGKQKFGPYVIPLQPGDVDPSDIIPVTDQFVGVGDSQAAVQLAAMLRGMHKDVDVRIGNDVSFSEIRHSMTILVGAFSNDWTHELTGDLRFSVGMKDGVKFIQDRSRPGVNWKPPWMLPNGKVSEDYSIITRLLLSESGRVVVAVAGITQYGNQAGGEFLTNNAYLSKALSKAPKNWKGQNLQFVIKTNVLGATTTPPEVVAEYFW
jgi:hypothetical protein